MISILMPIYNGIEFINQSVNSILNQTYKDWELLIGINGYEENSEVYNIAKKFENNKIKVFDMYTIKGKSNTLNELIKYCKYDYVSLLDVDDIWKETKLEEQIVYINDYDIIGTKCQYFGDSNIIPYIPTGYLKQINFFRGNPIINSSCLLKKELCYWSNEFIGIEDYELWIKLWKEGKKFYNLDKILVLHRIHNTSAFNSKGNGNNNNKLFEKYK